MIDLPVKSIRDLSLLAQSALEIGLHFGFTEDECRHPKFSTWLIEELKNIEQSKVLQMQLSIRRRIAEEEKRTPLHHFTDILTGKT